MIRFVQTIRCKPPIEFPIRELLFNEKSNFLCAVGQYRCAVIEISDHTRREFFREENRSGEIECRYRPPCLPHDQAPSHLMPALLQDAQYRKFPPYHQPASCRAQGSLAPTER